MIEKIEQMAAAQGLELFGIVKLGPEPGFAPFERWLKAGLHAGMDYLKDHLALRADPSQLLAGAQTALVVGLPYFLGDRRPRQPGELPRVAQYARLVDYHKVLWRRGEAVLAEVLGRFGPGGVGRVVVDSAPLLERALAARGGRGFIGKNTCFIHPDKGSFFLLAEILTSLDLPLDEPPAVDPDRRGPRGGCGSCRRCQVHCPTGALDQAYVLDANRCLAYWTIEHRGTIPTRFWPWLRLYVFGCDICQLVCPYNRKAAPRPADGLVRLTEVPSLYAVATMTQADYERFFGGTPMTRAKRAGLMRNALIAMTVTADPRLAEAIALALARAPAGGLVPDTVDQIRAYRGAPAVN